MTFSSSAEQIGLINVLNLKKALIFGLLLFGLGSENRLGYGIFHRNSGESTSESMGTQITVFQAEVTAFNVCADKLIKENTSDRIIYISLDSSAVLMALHEAKRNSGITSKLVHETCIKLNEL